MSLKISTLQKDGDASNEYILLEATEDVNIGNYAIVDRTFNKNGKVSNVHKHFFRFPSRTVKKGEYVSLRTGKGTPVVGETNRGDKVYRYFWGSDAPFWNDNEIEKAELLKVSTVATATA